MDRMLRDIKIDSKFKSLVDVAQYYTAYFANNN